jgi:hypothetical protein
MFEWHRTKAADDTMIALASPVIARSPGHVKPQLVVDR